MPILRRARKALGHLTCHSLHLPNMAVRRTHAGRQAERWVVGKASRQVDGKAGRWPGRAGRQTGRQVVGPGCQPCLGPRLVIWDLDTRLVCDQIIASYYGID